MATGDGRVEAIFIGSDRQGSLHAEQQVDVVPGKGIRGDRYFLAQGTYSDIDEPGRDLTLFEAEALDGLLADTGIELAPNEIRRNVMTRGI
ncbi:MAG: sulfurase, partial [Thermoleophilaceae bacterium]